MKLSEAGLSFIAAHEGTVLRLYNDSSGHCTVGVGHLVHHGRCDGRASEAAFAGGITRQAAIDLLRQDVVRFENTVNSAVKVPLKQNQFDALMSFSFNVGDGAFRASTLLAELNAGRFDRVRPELLRWTKGTNGVEPGLVTRRTDEADLFEGGGGGGAIPDDELTGDERSALARVDQRVANLQTAMADLHPEVPQGVERLEVRASRVDAKLDQLLGRLKR